MGVYSKLDSDDKIIQKIKDYKSIVIFGCEGCANDSIAFQKGYPLAEIIRDENTGQEKYMPFALKKETSRLKELLKSKNINTEIEIMFALCDMSPGRASYIDNLLKNFSNLEAVITMCCPGGIISLKKVVPNSIKIIPVMKTQGMFHTYRVTDESGKFIKMDMEKTSYIKIYKEIEV
jgi:hypothetical protein